MKKILLIEDNQDHRVLIEKTLKKGLGSVQITHTERIEEALEKLKKSPFDLILSDFYLPDGKGTQYIQKIAAMVPDIPLVIITGKGDEKTAARSIQAGADDYIVKTREALQALPKILNRTWAKHQSQQEKKKVALKRELKTKEEVLKKILKEVEALEEKVDQVVQKEAGKENSLIESVGSQVAQLKNIVEKFFFK